MKKIILIIAFALPICAYATKVDYRVILTSCGTQHFVSSSVSDEEAADLCIKYDDADCGGGNH